MLSPPFQQVARLPLSHSISVSGIGSKGTVIEDAGGCRAVSKRERERERRTEGIDSNRIMPACADYVLLRRDWSAGGQRDISLVDNHLRPALRLVRGPTSRKRAYHPLPFTALLRPRVQANRSTSRSPSLQQRISSFHLSLSLSLACSWLWSVLQTSIYRGCQRNYHLVPCLSSIETLWSTNARTTGWLHVLVCNVLCWVVSLVVEIHTHTYTWRLFGAIRRLDRSRSRSSICRCFGLRFAEDAVSINCSCFRKLEF